MHFPTQRLFMVAIPLILVLTAGAYVRSRVSNPEQGRLAVQESVGVALPDNPAWQQTLGALGTSTSGGAGLSGLESFFSGESLLTNASNTTEALGISLLTDYADAKRLGSIDPGMIDYIVSKNTSEITSINFLQKPKTVADLRIATGDSSLEIYSNQVSNIRDSYFSRFHTQMLSNTYTSPTDQKFLDLLALASSYYRTMANDLINTETPKEFLEIHLMLINNYLESAEALQGLAKIKDDPVRAIGGFSTYQRLQEAEILILSSIDRELARNGIVFTLRTAPTLP